MFQRNVVQAEYKNNNQNKIMPKTEYNAIIAQNLFEKTLLLGILVHEN